MDRYYSQYYYKRKTKKNKAYLPAVAIALFFVVLAVVAISLMPSVVPSKKYSAEVGLTCYFLSTNSFDDLASATVCAESIKRKGGAGYVHKAKKYHVLTAVYFDAKKANIVKDGIQFEGMDAQLLSIALPAVSYVSDSKECLEYVSGAAKAVKQLILEIYDLSNGLDTGAVSVRAARQQLNDITAAANNLYEKNTESGFFTKGNLKAFNDRIFEVGSMISDITLRGSVSAREIRYLNIDVCFAFVRT